MKLKRSERIVVMTEYLLNNPNKLIPLTYFVTKFNQAKSSISEDIHIIKTGFKEENIGEVKTLAGVSGGVIFTPTLVEEDARKILDEFIEKISEGDRLLAGGYIFMSDIVGNPSLMNKLGRVIATVYKNKEIDAVVTVATKGIPVAYAIASILNKPVITIRRDNKVTEGTTVAINYVSGSTKKIETMILSKRSLNNHSKVLLVDDFMRGGGVLTGMESLMNEFDVEVIGKVILTQCYDSPREHENDYLYLSKIENIDEYNGSFDVKIGNVIEKLKEAEKEDLTNE
ncbi:pur operon repressor [Gemella sanguinis]|mgnify:FL=1|jgi:pur operon repressor purR|uniref:Pur operon repressor n=1 Tax=Gemella sanguinis TaxID=84135 RepID=A0A2N6SDM8_9BACL|nr:pur operon repressor [Gemella sanguinis]NKZ25909.1 pur operon repressor [Gemella sanguinis]PMC52013.1 pur operon repressor [Gemella sanguinis]